MDVDNDFIEPSHESMEVNSAQPNVVADPSQITVPLLNKRPAQDVLAILAPQLPTKRIRAEKQCWKCIRPECAKIHVMTAREWIVMGGIADERQGPIRTRLIAQKYGGLKDGSVVCSS